MDTIERLNNNNALLKQTWTGFFFCPRACPFSQGTLLNPKISLFFGLYLISKLLNHFFPFWLNWNFHIFEICDLFISVQLSFLEPHSAMHDIVLPGTCTAGAYQHAKSLQLHPTICNPMFCSLPGSSLHGILQARILEWVAIPFSRRSSQPRD